MYSKFTVPVYGGVLGGLGQLRHDHAVREPVPGDVGDTTGRHLAPHYEAAGVGRGQVGADEGAVFSGLRK